VAYSDSFSGGGWAGKIIGGVLSRTQKQASLNLGIVASDCKNDSIFRDPELEKLDAYYENRQYASLVPFDLEIDAAGMGIPLRKRQPRIKIAFAKTLASRVTSKLLGPSVFPAIKIEDNPDDQEYFRAIVRESNLDSFLLEPTRRMVNCGEVFVRFYLSNGAFKKEWFHSKYCYPTFQDNGDLQGMRIQYVYDDPSDVDDNGSPKKKWFRLDLGMQSEIKYDNPPYDPEQDPDDVQFAEVARADHNFGFVQGEWFTTTGDPEGYGLCEDITDFIDELSYSLSQSSKAVSYNQDPQLTLSNMTEDEIGTLVRSSTKAWNLGKDGKGEFIESNMSGVERAMDLRDKVRMNIQDITRVVLLDPDKIIGSAQSGKAMEVLHGPLKDLIDELRMPVGTSFKRLVLKMGYANLLAQAGGIPAAIPLPPGYVPQSMAFELKWPPLFEQTLDDLKNKVAIATQASTANIIARATATKFVAEDFGIEDVDAEQALIAAQPIFNPFGGGF
jgi:hypothetical protein